MSFLGYYLYEEKSKALILSFQRFWWSKNPVIWLNSNIFSSITWKFKTLFSENTFFIKILYYFYPNFPKNEHFLLPHSHTYVAYQGVRNFGFSENLACFVFLEDPFWDSPFYFITDDFNQCHSELILMWPLHPLLMSSYYTRQWACLATPNQGVHAVVLHAIFLGYYLSGAFSHVHA